MLKFSLSLRTQSPRVEMFQQIAKDRGVAKKSEACGKENFVVEVGKTLQCSSDDIKTGSGGSDGPQSIKVDHVYPHGQSDAETVILYAQPGTKGFAKAHNVGTVKAVTLAALGR